MDESLNQYIERLSALPPRKRLEAFRAIPAPEIRKQVALAMPSKDYSEMLDESMLENLNRNVAQDFARRNPGRAA